MGTRSVHRANPKTAHRKNKMPADASMYQRQQAHRWRWRESNPRPRRMTQGFSGRSWHGVLIDSCTLASELQTSPVVEKVPRSPHDVVNGASLP